MKIILEVTGESDFDYEYFVDWLNDEIANGNMASGDDNYIEATIVSVDGKKKY